MHSRTWSGVLFALGLALLMAVTTSAVRAEPVRPFVVGVHVGARVFEEDLDLEDDIAFGLRVGMGASERFSVLLDLTHASPARVTTSAQAAVSALRGLTQTRLLLGTVRPYVLAGIGGVLYDFDDTSDAAVGALTAGGGVEMGLGTRAALYAEGSADIYRARSVSYSVEGEILDSTDRETRTDWTILTGIQVEF